MSDLKHTQPPWRLTHEFSINGDSWNIVGDHEGHHGTFPTKLATVYCLEPNANLMRAAPELLEALKNLLLETYAPDPSCSCHISPPCSDCEKYGALREFIKDAKSAINKAEGKL